MLEEIETTIKKLPEWAADEPVEKTPQTQHDELYIHSEPLGVVLVMGTWNYPFNLTIQPMVGAIAAGMRFLFWKDHYKEGVMTKPSSQACSLTFPYLWGGGGHGDEDSWLICDRSGQSHSLIQHGLLFVCPFFSLSLPALLRGRWYLTESQGVYL